MDIIIVFLNIIAIILLICTTNVRNLKRVYCGVYIHVPNNIS